MWLTNHCRHSDFKWQVTETKPEVDAICVTGFAKQDRDDGVDDGCDDKARSDHAKDNCLLP